MKTPIQFSNFTKGFYKLIVPMIGVFLSLLILLGNTGIVSAHASSTSAKPAKTLSITVPHSIQEKFPTVKTNPNAKVIPNSLQCQYFERQTHFGTICATVWQQCILSACVPVGVDINLSQGLVDYISSAGSNAVAAIVGAIVQTNPALAPFSSAIQATINFSISTIVNFAKSACGGTGVGLNVGFPDGLSLHC